MRRQEVRADTPRSQASGDDRLEIKTKPHPFIFSRDPKNQLNELIVETINRMGGVGEDAEKRYQACLNALFRNAREVVAIVEQELKDQPAESYLDRWSLVHLLAELKQPSSLGALDSILSSQMPEERSKDPHSFTTVGEEVVIRTTAVEAITRIAAEGVKEAQELLLKHVRHDNFSVKRAAVQGYLQKWRARAAARHCRRRCRSATTISSTSRWSMSATSAGRRRLASGAVRQGTPADAGHRGRFEGPGPARKNRQGLRLQLNAAGPPVICTDG